MLSGAKPSRVRSPSSLSPTSAVFAGLDDELHDARRVLSHGQEEDLRCALDRVLNTVEELSSLLKTAIKTQTDLETQLNLAKSNLQLVISNNEMLEEALKRETPCSAKDVGWRRWSAREVQNYNTENKAETRPHSLDYGPLNESGAPAAPSSAAAPVPVNGINPPAWTDSSAQAAPPNTSQESRFFKFRFSSGTRSPAISPHPSHLTSPSLSSLVPNAREKEIEGLQEQLDRERQAHKAADAAKAALEAELESLSQALFEEANNMVATERMRRAETEEELNQTRLEKEALRQALKLIESENGRLRDTNASPDAPLPRIGRSDSPSQLPVAMPLHSPPSPQSPTGSSTGRLTPRTPLLYETPTQLSGSVLEPAPEPSMARLDRKAASMEKLGESLPAIVTPFPVPLMPDEPSPWADVAS